jgi:hypothetical protein
MIMTDEEIAVAVNFMYGWGYPDFVALGIDLVLTYESEWATYSHDAELTWSQLRKLLEQVDCIHVKRLIAASPDTSSSVLHYLIDCGDLFVLEKVAANPSSRTPTLARLCRHEDHQVRMAVAENSSAAQEIYLALCDDPSADVRYTLADNLHAGRTVLERLVQDENPYVSARAQQSLDSLQPVAEPTPLPTANFLEFMRKRAK